MSARTNDPAAEAASEPAVPPAAAIPAPPRPLAVTGLIAAAWCVGVGLTVLTTITLIGWIAAPHAALGPGLPGVFRTAVNLWLVAHHAGFSLPDGRVGLLPLGLTVLPGLLLYRSGGWMVRTVARSGDETDAGGDDGAAQARVVPRIAVSLAAPYATLAALLALAADGSDVRPSAWQALVLGFVLAWVAGGLGAARALVASRGRRVRSGLYALSRLLPDRPRSLVMGAAGSIATLAALSALLVGAALAMSISEAAEMYGELSPGLVGGVLLVLLQLAFLPNAVIWGMSYAIGPGFSVGAGTNVSPAGVFLDVLPMFPPLAALPEPGPAPALSLFALIAPFVAGAVGGTLVIRAMPSPVYEAAPLWGFLSGVLTAALMTLLAALSGGPLGGGRLAIVGPSPWQVGLMTLLEVGVSAAIAAWVTNWLIVRRAARPAAAEPTRSAAPATKGRSRARVAVDAAAEGGEGAMEPGRSAAKPRRAKPRRPGRKAPAPDAAERSADMPRPVDAPGSADVSRSADVPRSAGVPRPARRPSKTSAVFDDDPLEFVEAEPVLGPRRPGPGSGESGRAENRGGAIYVLREDDPER